MPPVKHVSLKCTFFCFVVWPNGFNWKQYDYSVFLKAKRDRHILFPIYHVLVIILVKVIFLKKSQINTVNSHIEKETFYLAEDPTLINVRLLHIYIEWWNLQSRWVGVNSIN